MLRHVRNLEITAIIRRKSPPIFPSTATISGRGFENHYEGLCDLL
jgi:hypothetical protein